LSNKQDTTGDLVSLTLVACSSYIIVSEAAALRVKEKTNLLACVISVLTTFVTSSTIPYLINDACAGLGGKVGYIYGAFNVIMVVATYFCIPELKGRTLEEIDQLFASGSALRNLRTSRPRQPRNCTRTRSTLRGKPERRTLRRSRNVREGNDKF
jgi:hypothetical protein